VTKIENSRFRDTVVNWTFFAHRLRRASRSSGDTHPYINVIISNDIILSSFKGVTNRKNEIQTHTHPSFISHFLPLLLILHMLVQPMDQE
jgi:hypothetical protein